MTKPTTPQATQTAPEPPQSLIDLLMAQDDLRGHDDRGKALVEASQALQEWLRDAPTSDCADRAT
jgi:hypothetical protein